MHPKQLLKALWSRYQGASATTANTDSLKATVDVLAAELSSIRSALLGDGLEKVLKNKAKKRSAGGAPTAPTILRKSHNCNVSKEISLETVPRGVLAKWKQCYQSATPAIACELLCISECIRYFRSQKNIAKLELIPPELYEAGLETLQIRGRSP